MQLDKHTVGYLTYRAGIQGAMSTMIVRDTSRSYTSFSVHFGLIHSFVSLNYTYKMEEKQLKLRGSVKLVSPNVIEFYLSSLSFASNRFFLFIGLVHLAHFLNMVQRRKSPNTAPFQQLYVSVCQPVSR